LFSLESWHRFWGSYHFPILIELNATFEPNLYGMNNVDYVKNITGIISHERWSLGSRHAKNFIMGT
jgi:hypothetical protein